jgi:hypothetical protein
MQDPRAALYSLCFQNGDLLIEQSRLLKEQAARLQRLEQQQARDDDSEESEEDEEDF